MARPVILPADCYRMRNQEPSPVSIICPKTGKVLEVIYPDYEQLALDRKKTGHKKKKKVKVVK